MINKTKQFIIDKELISRKNMNVFAAVSAGIDSCVMLDILKKLQEAFKYRLIILHYNHNTRGKENVKEESFVESLSTKYDIPIKIKRLEENSVKKSEVYLRDQRYKFFNNIISNSEDNVVATAHNSDDNVETFLMRLFRGSHLKGLTGIKHKRGQFIRPLLSQTRKSIEKYAEENDIKFIEDSSNLDNNITRNYIRNKLIPNINNFTNFDINKNILKSLEDLDQYYSFFLTVLQKSIKESVKKIDTGVSLNKFKYNNYNNVIRKGLIEYCISVIQPLNYGISKKNFYLWDDFIKNSKPGKKKNILSSGNAVSERKEIIFGDFPIEKEDFYNLKLNTEILVDKKYKIVFTEVDDKNIKYNSNKYIEYIDGDKSGKSLLVRYWHTGDTFRPLGMKHRRKLSDFFIDLKLSTRSKRETPIICKNEEIIWIAGLRLSDQYKISDNTKKIYKIEMIKENLND